MNYIGAGMLAIVILIFVGYVIAKNISLNEVFAEKAVAIFSVFQVLQILSEMIVVAYFAYGNFFVNVVRILPFSIIEFLSASAFIVLVSSIIAGKFKKLWIVIVLSVTSMVCYGGVVLMCSMIYDIWQQVMGYTLMAHSSDMLGFTTVPSEKDFKPGDLATAYNIWSTPAISGFAVGFLLLQYVKDKIEDIKKQEERQRQKDTEEKKRKSEDKKNNTLSNNPPNIETAHGIPFVEGIVKFITLCMNGGNNEKGARDLAYKNMGIQDLGPAYPEQARYNYAKNPSDPASPKEFIVWESDLKWTQLSRDTVVKLRDFFKGDPNIINSTSSRPPYQKVKNILIEGIKEYYNFSS